MKGLYLLLFLSCSIHSFSQNKLEVLDISSTYLSFSIEDIEAADIKLYYGHTKNLELGHQEGLTLENLSPSTFYFVQAKWLDKESPVKLFSTQSRSSGNIHVYFNQYADNTISTHANAMHSINLEDTIIAYINRAQFKIDIANYNTGRINIVNALNTAYNRGVEVRYVGAHNNGTNNNQLGSLNTAIGQIKRPNDGEIMHNKFIVIDADSAHLAKVITGSVNHTNNSLNNDYNNLIIIEDQALALAYRIEFEEMFGSNTLIPNTTNAKFGVAKTDNTPHNFNIGGTAVDLYFSPSDRTAGKIEQALRTANNDLEFATMTFTRNNLGAAVEDMHNAGVSTKGIIENIYYFGSEYNGLLAAGVDVKSHFNQSHIMHHKYAVVDATNATSNPITITGSHNWSNSADDDYDENTLIIYDHEIANMYYEEFMTRHDEISSISEIESSDISIYPNPVNTYASIVSSVLITEYELYSTTGKLVKKEVANSNTFTVNLEGIKKGLYYLNLTSNNTTLIKKLILD